MCESVCVSMCVSVCVCMCVCVCVMYVCRGGYSVSVFYLCMTVPVRTDRFRFRITNPALSY